MEGPSEREAQRNALYRCNEQIQGFRSECKRIGGDLFHVLRECRLSYVRRYCPERCDTWGAGVGGEVACWGKGRATSADGAVPTYSSPAALPRSSAIAASRRASSQSGPRHRRSSQVRASLGTKK